MSKVSAKNTPATPQRASTAEVNLLEKRLSTKQDKRQPREDDNLIISDATPQVAENTTTTAITPLLGDTALILAQADTTTTPTVSASQVAVETATSVTTALNSSWVMGLAALGSVALVAHHYNTSNSGAGTGTVEGIAIDGYLQNANVYTVNGTTKTRVGSTDSNGKFSIKNPNGDLIQIEGGTNKDTGLANTVVLKAPGTAGGNIVVTPLTTTIAAMMVNDTHLTASQAAEKLKTSLGITDNVNLLTLDSIASNNTSVQKANVQIATALSLVTQASEADAVLNDLAATVNNSSVALNLNAALTSSLTSKTTLDTTTLSAISDKLVTLATASNIAALGDVQKAAMANDAPTLTDVPVAAQVVTLGQASALDDFKVADKNGDTLNVTLTTTNGTVNGLTDEDANTTGIQLTGTASEINAKLATATFTANAAGRANINISVNDGEATAVAGNYAMTATAVVIDTPLPTNDAPTLNGVPATAQAVTVGQAAALDDFTVADANGDNLTVTLTATHGTLNNLTDADANTAGIQLTGTANAINTQLAAATFTVEAAGTASIDISVTDGTAAAVTGNYAMTATAVVIETPLPTNDAPTLNGVPATAQAVTVGQAAALDDFTVADANGDNLTVTLTATHGTLNNLTDADANTAGIQLTGIANAINTQLAAATFTADAAGPASIDISVTDGKATAVTSSYGMTASSLVSGSIVAGPVLSGNDLTVNLYAANGTTQIGTASVDATGQYTANIGSYTGVVIAKVASSGTDVADYLDEATGQQLDLTTVLTAVGIASTTGLSLNINPLTTIAAQLAGLHADGSGSMSSENAVDSANTTVATAFGIQDSLIAPTTLVPVVDANGTVNTQANDYGKVLAVLSGLDQINHGNLQTAIQAFATDLASNNGQLSATNKFNLVVAAQDADLLQMSSELATTMRALTQIDAHDVQEVISSGRSHFSDDKLASALSVVLETVEPVRFEDIDAVIESMATAANASTEAITLPFLAQAAGIYISPNFGQTLNLQEAEGIATLRLGGVVAGTTVNVRFEDQYQDIWESDLVVGEGGILTLPEGTLSQNLWGEGSTDTATVTVTSTDGLNLTKTFGIDLYEPNAFNHNYQGVSASLIPTETGFGNGYTNSEVTIIAPYDWNTADHWQYRVGNGAWVDGPNFVYNENNNDPYIAHLQLAEGAYGTSDNNKIHMRTYDDAGNVSTEVVARYAFTVDTTAPTFAVEQDGQVTMGETGVVVLINDAILPPDQAGSLLNVVTTASSNHMATYVTAGSDADVNQPLTLSTTGLTYGSYHYYAVDFAGNIAQLQNGSAVIIDSQAPVVNENSGVVDQTVYLGQDLSVIIYANEIFNDPDGNPLTYTTTLLDANGTTVSSEWLTLNSDDPWSLTLTAAASDVAANLATGPLTIRLTATDSAGLVVKSVSDDFTLTYVPEILNHAPVLEYAIGSWDVNVGVDPWSGDIQTYALEGNFSDSDSDALTYALTNSDGTSVPDWLSIQTDSNGNRYLQATPLATNVGTYHLIVTATDGLSDPVSDNFDLTVGDDGTVFYPGQALTSFNLNVTSDAISGNALTSDGVNFDLGTGYTRFFGGSEMSDTATLHLDNANVSTLSSGTAPNLNVENFSTVNLIVDSHTELQSLSMYKLYSADQLLSQTVTIQTGDAVVIDWMDTADCANTSMSMSGSGDVTINTLDGIWGSFTDVNGNVQTPEMFLSANQLTGKLFVAYQGLSATLIGGQNDDTIIGGDGDDLIRGNLGSDTLTGSDGADTFYYESGLDANDALWDVINDFSTGSDQIRVNLSDNAIDANNLNLAFNVVNDYNTGTSALTGKIGESFYSTSDASLYIDADGNGSVTDSADFVIRSVNAINAGDLELMIAGTGHIV